MLRLKWGYVPNIVILLLLLFTAAACDEATQPEMVTPDNEARDMRTPSTLLEGLPVINEFYTNWDNFGVSDDVILYWDVSEASNVTIDPGIGEVAFSGEFNVSSIGWSMFLEDRDLEEITFTLTASNGVGSVTASTVVYFGPITQTDPSQPPRTPSVREPSEPRSTLQPIDEPSSPQLKVLVPTIHSFYANPEKIPAGGSSKLSWEVSNADTVTITAASLKTKVSSSGNMSVSPSATTTYQLTATNSAGTQNQRATITVGPVSILPLPKVEVVKPDLIVTDIWKKGSTDWHYIVKNQGSSGAGSSRTALIINNKLLRVHDIAPLDAGESRIEIFNHAFECDSGMKYSWSVEVDSLNAIAETDEGNNLRSKGFVCP